MSRPEPVPARPCPNRGAPNVRFWNITSDNARSRKAILRTWATARYLAHGGRPTTVSIELDGLLRKRSGGLGGGVCLRSGLTDEGVHPSVKT